MIHHRINATERLLILSYGESITLDEWKSALSQAIKECPEVIQFDSVVDTRKTRSFLTGEQIKEHAQDVKKMGMQDHPRRSVVIVEKKAHFGLSRMFELMTESDSKVERFTTESLSEAAAWLNKPEALLRAELDAASQLGAMDKPVKPEGEPCYKLPSNAPR